MEKCKLKTAATKGQEYSKERDEEIKEKRKGKVLRDTRDMEERRGRDE